MKGEGEVKGRGGEGKGRGGGEGREGEGVGRVTKLQPTHHSVLCIVACIYMYQHANDQTCTACAKSSFNKQTIILFRKGWLLSYLPHSYNIEMY